MVFNPFLRYSYRLNGEVIEAIALGSSFIDKAEESLDEGSFNLPINARGIEYEMNGTLEIEIRDSRNNVERFTYLIIFDEVDKTTPYGWFTHSLRVLEYTNKLNAYFVDTLVSTYPNENITIPARYRVLESGYLGNISSNDFRVVMPNININETIITENGELVINSVGSSVDYIELLSAPIFEGQVSQADLFVMIDNDILTLQNISIGNATFSNLDIGEHTIQYGLINVPDLTQPAPTEGFFPRANVVIYEFFVRTFDNFQLSLYDVITKLRNIKPFETKLYHADTRIFDIDETKVINGFTLKEILQKTPSPQFFVQKATMFQVLTGIFKYINSIPRLLRNGNNIDFLSRDDFNEIVGEFDLQGSYDFKSNQSIMLYGTKGVSPLERTLPNNLNDPNIETPANNFFKTIRATDVQLTLNENQWFIPLEKPIYRLTKFEVQIPNEILVSQRYVPSGSNEPLLNLLGFNLDLTSRVIDKKLWELKDNQNYFPTLDYISNFDNDIGERNNKSGNIYWEQNENGIRVADYLGMIEKRTLLTNVIQEALYDYFAYLGRENVFSVRVESAGSLPRMVQELTFPSSTFDLSFVRDLKFNIEYISLQDFNIVQEREDRRTINRFSEIALKQSDKQLNVELASRKSYGDLQRGALPNQTFTKIHNYLDELIPLFTIDPDGFVITERIITAYSTFLDVTYTATKNHNRLQEFIGVNQEYRSWEIPTSNKIYDRKEFYSDIILIKPHDQIVVTTNNLLTPKFYNQLVANLQNDKSYKKITFSLIYTDGMAQEYGEASNVSQYQLIIAPSVVVGAKQTLTFSIGFDDNQLAGNALEEIEQNSVINVYNKAVRYTNFLGKLNEFWLAMFSDIEDLTTVVLDLSTYDYDKYPLTDELETSVLELETMLDNSLINNGMLFEGSQVHGDYNPFIVDKDSFENLTIQYGASIMSYNYNQFIVGQRFTSNNSLVTNNLDDLYLYTYENSTFYGIFNDQLIKSMGSATKTLLNSSNVVITPYSKGITNHGIRVVIDSTLISGKTSWAIGDNQGNLYLACNEPINDFDFEGTHIDYRIQEIGKQPIIYQIISNMSLELDFSYIRGREVVIQMLDNSMSLDLDFDYIKGLSLDFDLDSDMSVELQFDYAVGKMLDYNLDSNMTLDLLLEYFRSKDIGSSINSQMLLDLDFEYFRSKDIGNSINNEMIVDLNFEFSAIKWATSGTLSAPYDFDLSIGQALPTPTSVGLKVRRMLTAGAYQWTNIGFGLADPCDTCPPVNPAPIGTICACGGTRYEYQETTAPTYEYFISQ